MGADAASDTERDEGPSAVPCVGPRCPSGIADGHLQLWLRGDHGVDCANIDDGQHVSRWRDLSDRHNDAVAPAGTKGPQCGSAAGTLGGRRVIRFTADPTRPTEGHLEVDLSALVNKPFTIAIVEQRSNMPRASSWLLGSRLPVRDFVMCMDGNPNEGRGLRFGYVGIYLFATTWGPMCDVKVTVPLLATSPTFMVLTYAPTVGLALSVNGAPPKLAPGGGLTHVMTGFIGRAYQPLSPPDAGPDDGGVPLPTVDDRYKGQLAEVVIFDVAVDGEQRGRLESYLRETWQIMAPDGGALGPQGDR